MPKTPENSGGRQPQSATPKKAKPAAKGGRQAPGAPDADWSAYFKRQAGAENQPQILPDAPDPAPYDLLDRAKGALTGLAVGDAIGAQVEFKLRGSFPEQKDMVGGGPFDLKPGQWTDDTIMALLLAESLIERGEFNAHDQLDLYTRWRDEGYMSPKGYCFDIGGATSRALTDYQLTGQPYRKLDRNGAGNGSLMRLAPIPLRYRCSLSAAMQFAGWQSMTTHHHPEAIAACRYMTALIVLALRGAGKEQLLAPYAGLDPELLKLSDDVTAIAEGSWRDLERDEVRSGGYSADSLEAALWCFAHTDSYRDCVLMAVNLGKDSDTTAAIAGQLAGAFYGFSAIPASWRSKLHEVERIERYAAALVQAD